MSYNKDQTSIQQLGYLLAEASKNVVFVVGSGLSIPAKLPNWQGLLTILKEEAKRVIIRENGSVPEIADKLLRELLSIVDPWLLGDEVARIIPSKEYENLIKKSLSADSLPIAYELIWSLKPSGVISFNLDELAAKALSGSADQIASSLDNSKYERFLILSRPFLMQPHGLLNYPKSWVLGANARNRLLKNDNYRRFIAALLHSRRLVIVGFRPNDFAFETLLLDDFRDEMTRGVEHFWIAADLTPEQRRWAAKYSINTIDYSAEDESHSEIGELLLHLTDFKPRSPQTTIAYKGAAIPISELPPDEELRGRSVEDIRRLLNAVLADLVADGSKSHSDMLNDILGFYKKYSGSVHMAWHIEPKSSYDIVWGYKVINEIGSGAFGGVWRATDPVDGQMVALKVLHESILHEPDFLEAFKRGVRAMEILSDARVPGMVRYIKAFDIPACVFMDFLDGMNFSDVIESSILDRIDQALEVVERAARIVKSGHELDKHVLHRDLKPSNIMLPDIHNPYNELDVIVLDFDLSWYEGAMGKSMMSGTKLHNYIAPEQLVTRKTNYSSRHTAVDVYGIGMLLYFACTKEHPALNVQNTKDFVEVTAAKVSSAWRIPFLSVPKYIALVIQEATYDRQERRLGLPSLIGQIELVRRAVQNSEINTPSALALLEIAVRLNKNRWEFETDMNQMNRIVLSKGTSTISIYFEDTSRETCFVAEITCATSGTIQKKKLGKYLESRCDSAIAVLTRKSLFAVKATVEAEAAHLIGRMNTGPWKPQSIVDTTDCLDEAASFLSFE